jgi:hypothetical protein
MRNADRPAEEYGSVQNDAANEHVKGRSYSGSYHALAMKQAFVLGANTVDYPFEDQIEAVLAGRAWAREQAT